MTNEDITPDGSVAPVKLTVEPIIDPGNEMELAMEAAQQARQDGIDKLMALGLTEDEAKAIAGI